MAKLTLSIDERVIERARQLAEAERTSISSLVEDYLDRLTRARDPQGDPPILARLRGILAGADPEEYRRHLERKYLG